MYRNIQTYRRTGPIIAHALILIYRTVKRFDSVLYHFVTAGGI